MKRFLAAILTVLMLLGTMTIGISAKKITPVYQIDDQTKKETEEIDYEKTLEKYLTTIPRKSSRRWTLCMKREDISSG